MVSAYFQACADQQTLNIRRETKSVQQASRNRERLAARKKTVFATE